jgi:hypothetical protein
LKDEKKNRTGILEFIRKTETATRKRHFERNEEERVEGG